MSFAIMVVIILLLFNTLKCPGTSHILSAKGLPLFYDLDPSLPGLLPSMSHWEMLVFLYDSFTQENYTLLFLKGSRGRQDRLAVPVCSFPEGGRGKAVNYKNPSKIHAHTTTRPTTTFAQLSYIPKRKALIYQGFSRPRNLMIMSGFVLSKM